MTSTQDDSPQKMEADLREKIYSEWGKLDWQERQRQVAVHLRDTHSYLPAYKNFGPDQENGDPGESWYFFATSCATMCPPWIRAVANLKKSSTAEE